MGYEGWTFIGALRRFLGGFKSFVLEHSNALEITDCADISKFLLIESKECALPIANRADGINDFSEAIALDAKYWRFVFSHAAALAIIDECFLASIKLRIEGSTNHAK